MLSNHDNLRHRTRYDRAAARRSEARARSAAVLLSTLRGTPFVYQGDEFGLTEADIPEKRRVDPGGRDGCRAPVSWGASPDHGWPTRAGARTWLPLPPEADVRNRDTDAAGPNSILHLYRRAIALRRATPALARGAFESLNVPNGVLGFRRAHDGDVVVVVLVNFGGEAVDVGLPGLVGATVALASDDPTPRQVFTGVLGPDPAVVVWPRAVSEPSGMVHPTGPAS
jgi:alpha-glucosidase